MTDALVIGSGPAGLMAAQALADAGRRVLVVEAKPSVGRKFLMAGKSGLNLTKDEPFPKFLDQYGESAPNLNPMLSEFDNASVQKWAGALGQKVFTGSSGRVFPKSMKASPLLRAWLQRLSQMGVTFQTRWRWQGWQGNELEFSTPNGSVLVAPNATVLALGGASWARLGSDGAWFDLLRQKGVGLTQFDPANSGLLVNWSPHMHRFFGAPVKATALTGGDVRSRGEFVVTQQGLEGSGIYSVSSAVRGGCALAVDLMPDVSVVQLQVRLSAKRGKTTRTNHLRKVLRLDPVKLALLQEFGAPLPPDDMLAPWIKALPVKHAGLCPLDQAISTAGGVSWGAVDQGLMLRNLPGMFVCGEMLDWEAPTGGYLITGCLATGQWAGRHAVKWCDQIQSPNSGS